MDERDRGTVERSLGRIEQQVADLTQNRVKIDAISERLVALEHGAVIRHEQTTNDLRELTLQSAATADGVQGLSVRVTALEEPVRQSAASRAEWRAKWQKRMTWAMSMAVGAWVVAEPIYKILVSNIATKWIANGFPFHP